MIQSIRKRLGIRRTHHEERYEDGRVLSMTRWQWGDLAWSLGKADTDKVANHSVSVSVGPYELELSFNHWNQ